MINPINFSSSAEAVSSSKQTTAQAQSGFAGALENALGTVNTSQQTANQMVTELASGNSNVDLHNVMIAMQKADVLLKTTVQVRDRVIEAYQEIMRMQV
ncbi:flagellar hook-basal body complex protein FliE [Sporolactobacillus laevolacticus]|uniref:Flagellar hook-basal body complex protein FliE n=1 Tax=Sporolactobacillus laevolacticus DSM 442 TaxID=1395513 RepID=V6J8F5_9BACL|nr:flagellar hook-basal body complex protein FliE [Sporolactobacillus laevolacticus]EST13074.1 flagellar hook-basal body protein FliE [Sporolactobacillus laevolacticus DSM 442]MDF2910982.1 flagellar hook-basal body complex protein FliE [Sporolactobacillus laevolacticus]MDN3954007.1 flagellar hook-basal body complex protein FliE [Sporolactobacillus laevolacticus]